MVFFQRHRWMKKRLTCCFLEIFIRWITVTITMVCRKLWKTASFYTALMPGLVLFKRKVDNVNDNNEEDIATQATRIISAQQEYFGKVLTREILPALKENNIHLLYNESIPGTIARQLEEYFFSNV